MPTVVQICNRALTTYLGLGRITSLAEESPAAQACAIHYDDTLSALLERHWWTFASGRQVLAGLVNDRPEWAYRYQMPAEALALRWVNEPCMARALMAQGRNPDVAREVAGTSIYCDTPQASAEFTRRITDPTLYPQSFADALSAALAAAMAQGLTEDRVRTQAAREDAARTLDLAIALDARQNPPVMQALPDYMRDRGVI